MSNRLSALLITGACVVTMGCNSDAVLPGEQMAAQPARLVAPPTGGIQACSPGYWKQSQHFDSWASPLMTTTSFNAIFGIGTAWFPNSVTLLDALKAGGGGKYALGRQATAALLSSARGFYPIDIMDVIAQVQSVYPNGDINGLQTTYAWNSDNLACPLN